MPRIFEITYRLPAGSSDDQGTRIIAPDPDAAREIFAQQNPGCEIKLMRDPSIDPDDPVLHGEIEW